MVCNAKSVDELDLACGACVDVLPCSVCPAIAHTQAAGFAGVLELTPLDFKKGQPRPLVWSFYEVLCSQLEYTSTHTKLWSMYTSQRLYPGNQRQFQAALHCDNCN